MVVSGTVVVVGAGAVVVVGEAVVVAVEGALVVVEDVETEVPAELSVEDVVGGGSSPQPAVSAIAPAAVTAANARDLTSPRSWPPGAGRSGGSR